MKISFYRGILLKLLKAHANQGISPVTLGDFNFSTSISHRRRAPTLIYGLGLTSVCRKRCLPGRVCCRGNSVESHKRLGVIETDMMRSCKQNQSCRMSLSQSGPSLPAPVGTFSFSCSGLAKTPEVSYHQVFGALITLWRTHHQEAWWRETPQTNQWVTILPLKQLLLMYPWAKKKKALLQKDLNVQRVQNTKEAAAERTCTLSIFSLGK